MCEFVLCDKAKVILARAKEHGERWEKDGSPEAFGLLLGDMGEWYAHAKIAIGKVQELQALTPVESNHAY